MTRSSSSPSKPAPKKASKSAKNSDDKEKTPKTSKVARMPNKDDSSDIEEPATVSPGNSPSRVSKFARKSTGVVVSAKLQSGHYGSVIEIKGNLLLTWFSVVSKDKIQDPFTKPFKDYVDLGLANQRDGIKSPEQKFVEDTRIIMMCSRKAADGTEMKQKKGSSFEWKQCVHQIPADITDKPKYRKKILKMVVSKMMDIQKTVQYPQEYKEASDLTTQNLDPANHKIPDMEVADMVLAFYDMIKTKEDIQEFKAIGGLEDFFDSNSTGVKCLQAKMNQLV